MEPIIFNNVSLEEIYFNDVLIWQLLDDLNGISLKHNNGVVNVSVSGNDGAYVATASFNSGYLYGVNTSYSDNWIGTAYGENGRNTESGGFSIDGYSYVIVEFNESFTATALDYSSSSAGVPVTFTVEKFRFYNNGRGWSFQLKGVYNGSYMEAWTLNSISMPTISFGSSNSSVRYWPSL